MSSSLCRISTTAAIAAAATITAGCGGGGSSGPSKSDFIAKADAICKRANDQREALQVPGMRDPSPQRAQTLARYTRKLKPVYTESLRQLFALKPPQSDTTTVTDMLSRFEGTFTHIDPYIAAASAEKEEEGTGIYFDWLQSASTPQGIAAKYGLKHCATYGNP
jgi:hypothetical protein